MPFGWRLSGGAGKPADSLAAINKWVYDSMQRYYYWAADMPAHPDYSLPTPAFFKRLLSPQDRFSWISDRNRVGPPKTAAELFGMHYRLIDHPFEAQLLLGVITCVAPGSPADRLHLQRGMLFSKVNDKPLTAANRLLVEQALQATAVILQLADIEWDHRLLTDSVRVALQSGIVRPKSVYAVRVFERIGKRTGYLAYFLCAESQDGVLLQSIEKLQRAGVDECILDLRYNPGGSVASAAKLAAMLAPVFDPDRSFITYTGNKHGGRFKQSFQQAISFSGNVMGKDMRALRALNLHLKRVYIITSSTTASAAEVLVNNLSAFMEVVRIGERTLGKDEASFPIEDGRGQWMLMPTIYKISDARGRGGYAGGLAPDYEVSESSRLPLGGLGVKGDALVERALGLIYGNTAIWP